MAAVDLQRDGRSAAVDALRRHEHYEPVEAPPPVPALHLERRVHLPAHMLHDAGGRGGARPRLQLDRHLLAIGALEDHLVDLPLQPARRPELERLALVALALLLAARHAAHHRRRQIERLARRRHLPRGRRALDRRLALALGILMPALAMMSRLGGEKA